MTPTPRALERAWLELIVELAYPSWAWQPHDPALWTWATEQLARLG